MFCPWSGIWYKNNTMMTSINVCVVSKDRNLFHSSKIIFSENLVMPATLHVFRGFKRLFWNLIQKYDQYYKRKPTKWQIWLSANLENVIYHRFFLMKIKYEVSEYQLNKAADPIITRKVLYHSHIIMKGNCYFDT